MSGINKVILVGRVGKDPEVRYLDNNVAVAKFSLATSDSYKDKSGNKVEQTEWHNIVLWRGLAEVAEKYVRKGNLIYIEGKIKSRNWEDKDGKKHYATDIVGDNMTMLGGKGENSGGSMSSGPAARMEETSLPASTEQTDDLPF